MRRHRRRAVLLAGLIVGVAAVGFASLLRGPPEGPKPAAPVAAPEGRVRVEVLNGGGVTGMARDATRALRTVGFDVVDYGNAAAYDPERPSAVIDRVGRPELAAGVAEALGIDNVVSEPDPNLYVDVSVLLGREWRKPGGRVGAVGSSRRARWDPRGWLGR